MIPLKYSVYLDQTMADSNKEDSLCVFSMFDAALVQIKIDLPFISGSVIQLDDVKYYQNNYIVYRIALLNTIYYNQDIICTTMFIHTET